MRSKVVYPRVPSQWRGGGLPPGLHHGPRGLPGRGQWRGLLPDQLAPGQHYRQLGRDGVRWPQAGHLPPGGRGRRGGGGLQQALHQLHQQGVLTRCERVRRII